MRRAFVGLSLAAPSFAGKILTSPWTFLALVLPEQVAQ